MPRLINTSTAELHFLYILGKRSSKFNQLNQSILYICITHFFIGFSNIKCSYALGKALMTGLKLILYRMKKKEQSIRRWSRFKTDFSNFLEVLADVSLVLGEPEIA